jgi:hypothetical protein
MVSNGDVENFHSATLMYNRSGSCSPTAKNPLSTSSPSLDIQIKLETTEEWDTAESSVDFERESQVCLKFLLSC